MKKILIIEDEPLISRIYEKTFLFENFTVELASDGEEGVTKAKSFQPEIILLDIMMPKKNGVETLEELKNDPETRAIPVIVLTNLVKNENADMLVELGAVQYITKSDHEPEEVVEIVKKILADLASKKNS